MPSAGNWPRTYSASTEARRDDNDKSPISDNGEKVETKVRNVGDLYKVSRNPSDGRQCLGRSPAISHPGFTDFSKTTKILRFIGTF